MTTDPERAGDTTDTESVEDEDERNTSELNPQIFNRPDGLDALQDLVCAPGIEVFQNYIVSLTNLLQFYTKKRYISRYLLLCYFENQIFYLKNMAGCFGIFTMFIKQLLLMHVIE